MNPTSEPNIERVTLNGDPWVYLTELPRPIAESIRRLLERYGIPCVLRTPWQWVQATPVIELETGGFMGMVGLFVPEVMQVQALGVLEDAGFLETDVIETASTEPEPTEPEPTEPDPLGPESPETGPLEP